MKKICYANIVPHSHTAYPSHFFRFCPPHPLPPLPCHPQPPTPTAFSAVMFLWLNGWSWHIWCAILLDDSMDLYMSSLGTLVPERPWCVFHATRCQVYWILTHNMVFYLYSDLISITHNTHTTYSGTSRLTPPINIYLHHLICAHSSYLYFIKWLDE